MTRVVIFGGGGHAVVVREVMEVEGKHAPAAVLVDDVHLDSVRPELRDLEVFPVSALDQVRGRGLAHAVVAIGDNAARRRRADLLRRRGFQLIQVRHSHAIVARSAVVGDGTVLMPGAVVGSGARLGCDVIVNTSASVDHDCVLEDGVHICPGAHLPGGASGRGRSRRGAHLGGDRSVRHSWGADWRAQHGGRRRGGGARPAGGRCGIRGAGSGGAGARERRGLR
ncbi:MAG TPA: sugar acetyltransferase [Methylomirabilota bacterium]|nr:sugar acetyltransferase [Methylomirabilota bacterium]